MTKELPKSNHDRCGVPNGALDGFATPLSVSSFVIRHSSFRPSRGFTILEVCVALAIAMLMLGAATIGISGVQREHGLRRTASTIETAARESLLRAVAEHHAVFIELGEQELRAASTKLGTPADSRALNGLLEVRRYGEKVFRKPRHAETWEFSADGVCEPLELRITSATGTVELNFDPLTGCARRKSIMVKG